MEVHRASRVDNVPELHYDRVVAAPRVPWRPVAHHGIHVDSDWRDYDAGERGNRYRIRLSVGDLKAALTAIARSDLDDAAQALGEVASHVATELARRADRGS